MPERLYIGDLPTPAAIIDMERVERNAVRMKGVLDKANDTRKTTNGDTTRKPLQLLPHSKTAYGIDDILRIQKTVGGASGFLASKAREAEALWALDHRDHIFVAFPHADQHELTRIRTLVKLSADTKHGIVSLLVSHKKGIDLVKTIFGEGPYPDIYTAIDVGGSREGRYWRHNDAFDTVRYASEQFGESFLGLNEYTGKAYGARNRNPDSSPDRLHELMREERDRISDFVWDCERRLGIEIREVGYGSTPTALLYKDIANSRVTQLHPGIFILGDHTTFRLGLIPSEDCALSVLTTVIDKKIVRARPHGKREKTVGRVILGPGGSKFMSSDTAPHGEGDKHTYGAVYEDILGKRLRPYESAVKLSEEMVWLNIPAEELDDPLYKIGNTVRLLIAHACPTVATAGAAGRLYLVEGDRVIKNVKPLALGYNQIPLKSPPVVVQVPEAIVTSAQEPTVPAVTSPAPDAVTSATAEEAEPTAQPDQSHHATLDDPADDRD